MDPARFPHAPHPLAPDSRREDPVIERRKCIGIIAVGLLATPLAAEASQADGLIQ